MELFRFVSHNTDRQQMALFSNFSGTFAERKLSCCNLLFKRWADTLDKPKHNNLYSNLSFVSMMSCSFDFIL